MSAGSLDISIEQGATFEQTLIWKDSAATPINLTGYTARMQARASVISPTTLLSWTSSSGNIQLATPLSSGTIIIRAGEAQTAALNFDTALYDLELVDAAGRVTRLLKGTISLDPEVTHP